MSTLKSIYSTADQRRPIYKIGDVEAF